MKVDICYFLDDFGGNMKKILFCAFLILSVFHGLFAGDSAVFVDEGFSSDGKVYVFGQYGTTDKSFQGWAELYAVDIEKNDYIDGEFYRIKPSSVTKNKKGKDLYGDLVGKSYFDYKKYNLKHATADKVLYIRESEAKGATEEILFKDFVKYSLPAVGNEFVWGAAFVSYSVILGHLGEDIVAANSVVNVARNLSSIVCFGMAYGGAILLGKQIGEGRLELAGRNARRLMLSTIGAGVLGSIFMVLLRPVLPLLAERSPAAADFRNYLLYINAYSIVGATVNTVLICGIFRSGGDSKFGFLCDGFFMWFVMIPLGFLSALVFKLSPLAVYFILYLELNWRTFFLSSSLSDAFFSLFAHRSKIKD